MMMLVPAVLVASGLASALMPVTATACPPRHTEIRVSEDILPPLIDDSKTSAQLKAMDIRNALTNDPRFRETVGLTAATISVSTEIRTRSSGSWKRASCVSPQLISIKISTAPNVYLDSDHGPCLQQVAMDHEMGHVEIDRNLIDNFVPIFRARLSALADAIGSVRSASDDDSSAIREQIEGKVDQTLSFINDSMALERALKHQEHDSPDEYRRVSMACSTVTVNQSSTAPRSRSQIGDR
jgi:hypothetical protein